MASVRFVPDKKGIAEICKSPEMESALLEGAQAHADAANRDAETHKAALQVSELRVPPYRADVDDLRYTSVGVAYTGNHIARECESRFKSLSRTLHW